MFVDRLAARELQAVMASPLGRCVILTGARQTGKTTLLRRRLEPGFDYWTFDEVLTRQDVARRPASEWLATGRPCIFDEVQKAPEFLGTVKVMIDEGPPDLRVVLSGSAQIRLLSGVRETLAGRAVTQELFPLSVAELAGVGHTLLEDLMAAATPREAHELLRAAALAPEAREAAGAARTHVEQVLRWGGMPALLALPEPAHRRRWLDEYCQTYLQRDLADLGRVRDLDDFVRLERVAAARTAGVVSYADIARDADLSPLTAKKYLRYLELSYQAFTLPGHRAAGPGRRGRLLKAPKLHFLDLGVQRALVRMGDGLTGAQLESAVVGEVHKLVRTLRLDAELSHLRTKDGREVDLLARLPSGGYLAFEVKAAERATRADARHLRGLQPLLDGPLLAGLVVHRGREHRTLGEGCFALPFEALFVPVG